MKTLARILIASTTAALLALSALIGYADAAGTTPTQTKVAVSFSPRVDENGNPVKGKWVVTAAVMTADGKSVNNHPVNFYEKVDFVGARDALIGTATTDSTGTAAIAYQPARNGDDVIVARVAPNNDYAASEGSATLTVADAVPPYQEQPTPLASVGEWLAVAFGVLVASTWAILLGVFARSALGIRGATRPQRSETKTATSLVATES